MRFGFRELPVLSGPGTRARPILDVVVEGLELAPQACLLDSGATAVRMGVHVAEIVGIELSGAPTTEVAVGGALVKGRMAEVSLEIADGDNAHRWDAPVWFCDPWTPGFGLLGLTGFFDHFLVTMAAYEESFELQPV